MSEIRAWMASGDYGAGVQLLADDEPIPPDGVLLGAIIVPGVCSVCNDDYMGCVLTLGPGPDGGDMNRYLAAGDAVLCAQLGMFGLTWKEAQS